MSLQLILIADTYSLVGTKTLQFTESQSQSVRFTDTGGIFGDAKNYVLSFESYRDGKHFVIFNSGEGEIPCVANGIFFFADGHTVFRYENPVEMFEIILKLSDSSASPNLLPKLFFPATVSTADATKFAYIPTPDRSNLLLDQSDISAAVHYDRINNNVLPISLKKTGDCIQVSIFPHSSVEIPLEKLPVTIVEESLVFKAKFLVGENSINGFSLKLPTPAFARRYATKLSLKNAAEHAASNAKTQTSGLLSRVNIIGTVKCKKIEKPQCEAELLDNDLVLFYAGDLQPLVRFNLSSANLSIEGTSSSFIISDSKNTILKISAQSAPFHQAIFRNRAIRSAAYRSSNVGPYVSTTTSDKLVRLEQGSNILHLGNGQVLSNGNGAINNVPELLVNEDQPTLKLGDISLRGQLPMLQGIAVGFFTPSVVSSIRNDFKNSLSALLGLEGKYFMYSTFGQIAEMQLSVTAAVGLESSEGVSSLTLDPAKQTFLAYMMQNAALLGRNLETTINYLPAFAVGKDRELLSRCGLEKALNVKSIENAYQRALSGIMALNSHLYRIDASVSRLSSLRKALSNEDGIGKFSLLG
jgi:hypothetical protein